MISGISICSPAITFSAAFSSVRSGDPGAKPSTGSLRGSGTCGMLFIFHLLIGP